MTEQIERELRWVREALALVEASDLNTGENSNAVHQQVIPPEFQHLLGWEEDRLQTHHDRLTRDLRDARGIEYEQPDVFQRDH